ncbi:DUF3102 domain-containing protein [Leptospira sp. 201903071]|uniref:DUF3102 domain-containing protein n=1 Tax=Leptospira ainazelensis TaxID=2810034 RepID=UPI001965B0C1|nr:DUF3102 domain-containing protein [Leptospira ainazelensis]MBM9499697.1 DUF3102 domain-containing protein [Leptospira ainazelensis]
MKLNEKRLKAVQQKSPGRDSEENPEISNSLVSKDDLAEKINLLLEGAVNDLKNSVMKFITAGELLIQKRKVLPHGQFIEWTKNNIHCSTSSAQRYMFMAEHKMIIEAKKPESMRAALRVIDESLNEENSEKVVKNVTIDRTILQGKEYFKRFRAGDTLNKKEKQILIEFLISEKTRIESQLTIKISNLESHLKELQ